VDQARAMHGSELNGLEGAVLGTLFIAFSLDLDSSLDGRYTDADHISEAVQTHLATLP